MSTRRLWHDFDTTFLSIRQTCKHMCRLLLTWITPTGLDRLIQRPLFFYYQATTGAPVSNKLKASRMDAAPTTSLHALRARMVHSEATMRQDGEMKIKLLPRRYKRPMLERLALRHCGLLLDGICLPLSTAPYSLFQRWSGNWVIEYVFLSGPVHLM